MAWPSPSKVPENFVLLLPIGVKPAPEFQAPVAPALMSRPRT